MNKKRNHGKNYAHLSLDDDSFDKEIGNVIHHVTGSYSDKDTEVLVQNRLRDVLQSNSICLICIDDISKSQPVWNCVECSSLYHLDCIQKWAKDSIFAKVQALQEFPVSDSLADQNFQWVCPKCRFEYPKSEIPCDYYCFCKKKKNPKFDPWLVPHSCGEVCQKNLKNDCGHTCLLLCHPGPCPPCPVMVKHPCFCLSGKTQMRRCSKKEWSCGGKCLRTLNCGQHKCQDGCHKPPCEVCPRASIQECQCGRSSETRPCSDAIWSCGMECGKVLNCAHHSCKRICHKDLCGDCPRADLRICPCGKKTYNLPCTEDVPVCGDTCAKPLSCSIHQCAERCHKGTCPPCLQFCNKTCRCGAREKETPCSKTFSCEVKCKKSRDCRKHLCNKKCCAGDCSTCDQPCGKTLSCGKHKCQSRCHQMPCFPCNIMKSVSCTCGQTSISVPCGWKKNTPPRCQYPCQKPPLCRHLIDKTHPCHTGDCPPCESLCGEDLPCGHSCFSTCHDAVPVEITQKTKIVGPWDIVPPRFEIRKLPCPPCKTNVEILCRGKHESFQIPCCESKPMSCSRNCGRLLNCESHSCEMDCHALERKKCEPCQRKCSTPRESGCAHPCEALCHRGPCAECEKLLRMNCHCGILEVRVECRKWINMDDTEKERIRSCTSQCFRAMECGHPCSKECHSGECSTQDSCRKKVILKCPCKQRKVSVLCSAVPSYQNNDNQITCNEKCTTEKEKTVGMKNSDKNDFGLNNRSRRKKHSGKEYSIANYFHNLQYNEWWIGLALAFLFIGVTWYFSK